MAELVRPAVVGPSVEPFVGKGLGAWREVIDVDRGSKGEVHGTTRAQDALWPGLGGAGVSFQARGKELVSVN